MKAISIAAILMLAGAVCAQQFMIGVRRAAVDSGPTDYSQDEAAMFVLRMNGATVESGELDYSTNANHFSRFNNLATSTNVPPGYAGASRDFDSATGAAYLFITNNVSLNPTNAITLAAWHRPDAAPVSDRGLISKYYTTSGLRQYNLALMGTGAFSFWLSSSGEGGILLTSPDTVSLNTYYHVAGTYDGETMRLYIDGVETTNRTHSGGIYVGTGDLNIGRYNGTVGGIARGQIDQVGAWSRAFSAEEIGNLYNDGIEGVQGGND